MADDIGCVPTASYELLDFASAADHGIIFKEVKNRGNRQSKHKWEAQIPLGAVDSYVANEEKRTTCNYVLAPVRSCMHFLFILFYFILLITGCLLQGWHAAKPREERLFRLRGKSYHTVRALSWLFLLPAEFLRAHAELLLKVKNLVQRSVRGRNTRTPTFS